MTLSRFIGDGVWLIDSRLAGMEGYAAVYALRGNRGAALVDSGVSAGASNILTGLRESGIAREEILYIVVTHIHLDHSGGAGDLVRELPNARVVVAAAGLDALARPERLVASARRALGAIADLYGDMLPIDRDRLQAAEEEGLDLGGRPLRLVPTPGHATSHFCVVDEASSTLFSGDSLGIYLKEEKKVVPVTPLPDFDLKEQRRSLRRLEDLDCARTCFAHFGSAGGSATLARESLNNLELMVEAVETAWRAGAEPAKTAGELKRLMGITSPYGEFMFGGMSLQNVQGITRYLEKNQARE